MFIAYAYIGRDKREVKSTVHDTREAAANELLNAYLDVASVSTCKAFNGFATGMHILSHDRLAGMAGKHKGFITKL